MDILIYLLAALHTAQAILTLYTLQFSYLSILKLLSGDTARKAAKYSNKAALQAFHARGTQAAGLAALVTSALLSLMLGPAFSAQVKAEVKVGEEAGKGGAGKGEQASEGLSGEVKTVLNLAEFVVVQGAAWYIEHFWKSRAKIPNSRAGDYNDAITTTNSMRINLEYLAVLWAVSGGVELYKWQILEGNFLNQ